MRIWNWGAVIVIPTAVVAVVITALALSDTRARSQLLDRESRLIETRHGAVEYAEWGDGAPVLVLHGAGGGFDQGQLLANSLGGENFHFISVSRFGYLRSALPQNSSTAAQAEALLDLLDSLGVERAHILAMSGGVPPALKFAEMFPGRTGNMVLLSSAPFTPFSPEIEGRPVPTWVYSALLGNDVVYWALSKIARRQLREAFDARADLYAQSSPEEVAFVEQLIDGFLPASQRLPGLANEGAAVDPEALYDLEAIQADVLVVHARDDSMNLFEIGAAIAERTPRAEFVEIGTGGHLLLGHHEELSREIAHFFASARD